MASIMYETLGLGGLGRDVWGALGREGLEALIYSHKKCVLNAGCVDLKRLQK